jgi:hypothetical protein
LTLHKIGFIVISIGSKIVPEQNTCTTANFARRTVVHKKGDFLMPIVSQFGPFSYSSYLSPFPFRLLAAPAPRLMLPAPKVVALLPARVPPAPVYTVHWTLFDEDEDIDQKMPTTFPTPEEMEQDIRDTFRRIHERFTAAHQ